MSVTFSTVVLKIHGLHGPCGLHELHGLHGLHGLHNFHCLHDLHILQKSQPLSLQDLLVIVSRVVDDERVIFHVFQHVQQHSSITSVFVQLSEGGKVCIFQLQTNVCFGMFDCQKLILSDP